MGLIDRALALARYRRRSRYALALSGGGVVGGMYEVGALAALEERLEGTGHTFDVYVGCSAGAVVATLLANGIRASEIYRILDEDLADPLNFRRGAVYDRNASRRALGRVSRALWAIGRQAFTRPGSVPDMIAMAEGRLPAGFFSLEALEIFMRTALEAKGMKNSFSEVERTLLIPAVDLDRAERVVFGRGELADVPISQAVAASSAIPGFFEPYTIGARDYVDGGVGFTGHADLAAEAGADVVFVVNPLVPRLEDGGAPGIRSLGLYTILEQAGRIYSQNLLQLGLAALAVKYPRTDFFLLEPPRTTRLLFGPSMGFAASRAALRYGYSSTREWMAEQGAALVRRLCAGAPWRLAPP